MGTNILPFYFKFVSISNISIQNHDLLFFEIDSNDLFMLNIIA